MTRINVVPPGDLTDQHLLAEYRELPRVFQLARAPRLGEKAVPNYTLGTGHVRFFYPRTGFLHRRQRELVAECQRRGFQVQHITPPAPIPGLDDDWQPTEVDFNVNLGRLRARLAERPGFYTHYGRPVDPEHYGSCYDDVGI